MNNEQRAMIFENHGEFLKMLNNENKSVTETIKVSKNSFGLLKQKESKTINFDIVDDTNTTNKYPSII